MFLATGNTVQSRQDFAHHSPHHYAKFLEAKTSQVKMGRGWGLGGFEGKKNILFNI